MVRGWGRGELTCLSVDIRRVALAHEQGPRTVALRESCMSRSRELVNQQAEWVPLLLSAPDWMWCGMLHELLPRLPCSPGNRKPNKALPPLSCFSCTILPEKQKGNQNGDSIRCFTVLVLGFTTRRPGEGPGRVASVRHSHYFMCVL